MARHNVPPFARLWQKYETLYIGIFILALQRLSEDKCDKSEKFEARNV